MSLVKNVTRPISVENMSFKWYHYITYTNRHHELDLILLVQVSIQLAHMGMLSIPDIARNVGHLNNK